MKMTVLGRILVATLLPGLLVLIIVVGISSLYSSINIIIIAGMLGMLFLGLCVYLSTRGIVRHIRRITDSFNRVANDSAVVTLEGEHIPIENTNVVELDTLQSALISMIMQLRKAHDMKLKAVEAEIEKEKLIASAEARMNFFAIMSHEIRTPMNVILGISTIMLHKGDLTPQQEKYIQDIKISTDALLNIVNAILDISKLETGNIELIAEHYNFKALLDNIVSLSTHLATQANLRFIYEPSDKLPLCLYGDGVRLRQILLNLIGNAVKYTKKGFVLLRVTYKEDSMCFDVADSGIGIKQSEIDTIFESYKQLDTRRNRSVTGTGLGLSINKKLVELMGGTITVKSVYEEGTIFSVTIPVTLGDESKLAMVLPGKSARYSEALRVLIVDDDKTNLYVSSGLFNTIHGILCDTAISGREAIDKVQKTDYDIIFMDHMMPELDGLDTTRYIRQLGGKYRKIPIIALTANALFGTQEELLRGGMNDFLTKPIQQDKLQEILNTWVPQDKRILDGENGQGEAAELKTMYTDFDFSADPFLRKNLGNLGIDAILGLENIGFDEDMYLRSLRIFKERIPFTIQLLNDLLEQEDMRKFHIHVHGLKYTLASIGAITFLEEVSRLEQASLEDHIHDCRVALPPFSQNLQLFYKALEEVLPGESNSEGKTDFDEKNLMCNLEKLCAALENYDYESVTRELCAVLAMKSKPEMSESIPRLKLYIDNFDYSEAAALIRELLISGQEHM